MGMGGVQRTAKFVKFLPLSAWEPVVLTVNPKIYLAKDDCLLGELKKDGIKIYRTGGDENTPEHKVVKFKKDSNRKFLSNLSQTVLIPDSKILWKKKALALADKIFAENDIDIIYSTAPPYTDFLIACELKKKYNVPVVLDYRDSWIDCPNNFYPTPVHKSIHKKMEAGVLKSADKIVTINSRIKELIIERYPFKTGNDISIIPQGFDPDDFEKYSGAKNSSGKMRITYSGSFLNYYTPKYFLKGLALAISKNPGLKNKVEACFIGSFPDEYKSYIASLGLTDISNIVGYVEHTQCIKLLLESDILWMMINKTERSDLHSTGKLYEYFGAKKPILACVPAGVARESLKKYGAVKLTGPDDVNAISEAILEFFEMYKNNSLPKPNEELISSYNRKKLTGELAGVFGLVLNSEEVKENKTDLVHT
jgi:glycosyltransferase involved in cell wall biosynthesis